MIHDCMILSSNSVIENNLNMNIIYLFILSLSLSAPFDDYVNIDIPGYQNHKWYSGYLQLQYEESGAFHYIFFQSQRDPEGDPIVMWFNGGPGCSSLIGMVYENGPFVFVPNTTTLEINNYSWNKQASLLYISTPQGTGFSYGNVTLTDQTVAEFNLQAILSFYGKFPNLRKNQFYLTGQSYAGIYIPYLTHQIVKYNRLPSSKDRRINLQGIMIGNACTDPTECYYPRNATSLYQYQFLWKHTYIPDHQYQNIKTKCSLNYSSQPCLQARETADQKFSLTKTNIFNIYSKCYHQPSTLIRQSGKYNANGVSCEDYLGMREWFNNVTIQQQLHVKFGHFQQCSDYVARNYIMFENASYWLYPSLLKENLKIWIFSGDVDADVPIPGTIKWLMRLKQQEGLPTIEPWRQWWVKGKHSHEDQVGGMVWQLRNITFVTVRGAGHKVPMDKRPQSYAMLQSFLKGELPPYK